MIKANTLRRAADVSHDRQMVRDVLLSGAARIDALTAMVERLMHRAMVLDCAGDDDVVMLTGVSTRDLVREARALIGEDRR